MAIKGRAGLKTDNDTLFVANGNQAIKAPLHNAYNENEIDSAYNKIDDKLIIENQAYNTSKSYLSGDICTYLDRLLVCSSATTGSFDTTKWREPEESLDRANMLFVTVSSNVIDLGFSDRRNIYINASGVVTVSNIVKGLDRRRYRFHLHPDISNLSIVDQTADLAISNGTGELAVNRTDVLAASHQELVGREYEEMSDWFEVVCRVNGGEFFNSVYKIQKHRV